MSAMYVGHRPGEPPSGRGGACAVLLLCALPLSVLWCTGAYFALIVLPYAPASFTGAEGVLARMRFAAPLVLLLASTGLGLAALWSVLVPRVLRPIVVPDLGRWQLYGLRLGSAAALVLAVGTVASGQVAGAVFFLWPVLVSWVLIRDAGEWLLNPWRAR